jgi:hypothetical protein
MYEVERLRDKVKKCRQLALLAGDIEIQRRLVALADEFYARAVRASAQANIGRGCSGRVFSKMARERYIARSIQHWHIVMIDADGKETIVGITDSEEDAMAEAVRLEREAERIYQAQQYMLGNRREQ